MKKVLLTGLLAVGPVLVTLNGADMYRFEGTVKANKLPQILYFSPTPPQGQAAAKPPIVARVDENGRFTVDLAEDVDYRVASHPPCAIISDMVLQNGRPLRTATESGGGNVRELPGVLTTLTLRASYSATTGVSLGFKLGGQPTAFLATALGLTALGVPPPVAVGVAGGIRLVSDPCADSK